MRTKQPDVLQALLEDALGQSHVHADVGLVDELRHGHVARDAHDLIRLMLRQVPG